MRNFNLLVAALAAPALVLSTSVHAAAATGSAQPTGGVAGGAGQTCRVKIVRSAAAGVFDVVRQVLSNGNCICRVTTGPRSQGGSAEAALSGLLSRRSCADAPLASSAAGSGGLGPLLAPIGALGAGGAAAAAGGGGGSASP